MSNRRRLLSLMAIMALVVMVAVGISIAVLYRASFEEQRARLVELAQSQARLMEAVARFDEAHSQDAHPEGAAAATLSQITEAQGSYEGFGETGEFALARRDGDDIAFLTRHRHGSAEAYLRVPLGGVAAEPMRRALRGQSGTIVGLDYRGATVLAAFEPVALLDFGIVAKIDLSEIRAPFVRAGTLSALGGLVLILLGVVLFHRLSTPLIENLEATIATLKTSQRIASLGSYELDCASGKLTWCDEMFHLVGREAYEFEPTVEYFVDSVHPDDRDRVVAAIANARERGAPYDIQFRVVWPDGTERLLRDQVEVDRGRDNQPARLRGALHDITERARAEELLRESELRLSGILNLAPEAIVSTDETMHITIFSKGAEKTFGYSAEEVIGKPLDILLPKDLRERHQTHIEAFSTVSDASRSMSQRGAIRGLRKDASEFSAEASVFKLEVAGRQVYTAMVHDITERKNRDEANQRFGRILDSSLNEIYVFDAETYLFLQVNQGARGNLGYTMEELHGLTPWDIKSEIDEVQFREIVGPLFSGEREVLQFETLHERKNGTPYPVEVHLQLFAEESQSMFLAVIQDITERREVATTLRLSEAALTNAQRIAHVGNWEWNIVTGDLAWSDEIYRIFGLRPQEFGATYDAFLNAVHPDDRDLVVENVNRAVSGEGDYDIDHRILLPDGEVRDVNEQGEVLRNEKGEPFHMSGVVHDITDRKRAEEEIRELNEGLEGRVIERTAELDKANQRLKSAMTELKTAQSHMVQAGKLSALGTLMAGVAHELNNPLMGIQNYVDYSIRHVEHAKSKSALEKANREIGRVTGIVSNMLSYARPAPDSLSDTDIEEAVKNTLRLAGMDLDDKRISVETSVPSSLPTAWARADGLQQVLLNLVLNARDALAETEDKRLEIKGRQENGRVIVDVEDSGPGIPEALMERIFDPFFSTKAPGAGTGMGLAVSRQIIEAFGGELTCESGNGGGTKFSISLPASHPAP